MTGRSMRMERAALSRALRGEGRVVLTVGDLAVRSRGAATEAAGIKMLPDPLVEEAAAMSEEEVAALRERILRKLAAARSRHAGKIAERWTFDEAHDQMVPPRRQRPAH